MSCSQQTNDVFKNNTNLFENPYEYETKGESVFVCMTFFYVLTDFFFVF